MESKYRQSAALLERAKKVLAGGVSSEFRKYNHPHAIFYTHGSGSRIYDVDGNEYLDYTLSQGPLIMGHSHPAILKAVTEYSATGQLFAGQHLREIELAEKLQQLIPSAELLRFCLDGSEAVQTAFRVARAKTGKSKFLRFEGHYHGWMDNVCLGISAPSADALGTRENPNTFFWSEGIPERVKEECIIISWNDKELFRKTIAEHAGELAAVITEPVMCNSGCILPQEGFLELVRDLCTHHSIALIFDEVITGFRVGLGGAQTKFNIIPDLSVFAKAMAGGYPLSVIVGKKEWMHLLEEGKVIQAGTMNSSNATIAASLATIEILEQENVYEKLYSLGQKLMAGLQRIALDCNQNMLVQGLGPMFHTAFTEMDKIKDFRDVLCYDKQKLGKFISGMHDRGIRIIGRGLWYISGAHTEKDIDYTLDIARDVLKKI
jgi:glutamate-1-semialdehyde 2,1-aminomutase